MMRYCSLMMCAALLGSVWAADSGEIPWEREER
jgi:hypothetical protein